MKFFYFGKDFIDVQSLEENFRFLYYMSVAELSQDLLRSFRHEGFEKACACGNALDQIPEYGFQTVFLRFIFCQCPRHGFVNVFVAAFEEIEDLRHGICHTQFIHLLFYQNRCIFGHCFQVCIHFFCHTFIRYGSAEVFICHGNGTVYQISKCICKVRIETFYHQFP